MRENRDVEGGPAEDLAGKRQTAATPKHPPVELTSTGFTLVRDLLLPGDEDDPLHQFRDDFS